MVAITKLGLMGSSYSKMNSGRYDGKTVANAFQTAQLIFQFDLWRGGYAGAVVEIFKEGTTTKASVYEDVNLTTPADNPQVLISQTLNGRTYGRFIKSLYTPDSYYLKINGIETTGVIGQSLRTLINEDATDANVTSDKGGVSRTAGERAGETINVRDFGAFLEIEGSTTENTETLTTAIGIAAAANGGDVILPAGTFKISTVNLPADVTLRGQGRNATIIQSEEDENVITVTGDNAGMADMTLDGINLQPGSVGVSSIGHDDLQLRNVMIKRFETGMKMLGGSDHHYSQLRVNNCGTCVELRGDSDESSSEYGSDFVDLTWVGGEVSESTVYGLYLRQVDRDIRGLKISDVNFIDNVGTSALYVQGAEQLIFEDLNFTGNIIRHVLIEDSSENEVTNIEFMSCEFTGREIKLGGSCQDVIFDRPLLAGDLSINANNPAYPIMFRDAVEESTVTQTGATDKISRWVSVDAGVYRGQTTATVTTATVFKRILEPGEIVHLEVISSAVQRNVDARWSMRKSAIAYGPAASLPFDTQTANFTTGATIIGGTSGASGMIQTVTDAGVTGVLGLIRVTAGDGGMFQNNEPLTDSAGGAAQADGTLTYANSIVMPPVQVDHYAGAGTGVTSWNCDVTTSGREVQVKVIGPTTGTVDWNVMVRQNDRP